MTKLLKWFENEYKKVLESGLSNSKKDQEYSNLMTEMEQTFYIPMIKNEEWEKENKKVFSLYRKIAISRKL